MTSYEPPSITRLGTINELTRQVSEPYLRRSNNDPWVTDLNTAGFRFLGGYTTAPLTSSITG